jgi:hypothetical protein
MESTISQRPRRGKTGDRNAAPSCPKRANDGFFDQRRRSFVNTVYAVIPRVSCLLVIPRHRVAMSHGAQLRSRESRDWLAPVLFSHLEIPGSIAIGADLIVFFDVHAICPTGILRIHPMRKLPVVPIRRMHARLRCRANQNDHSRIPPR